MKTPLRLFLACLLLGGWSGAAMAQTSPQHAKPGKRLEWPHTFGGQPDFEFEKNEVFQEISTENARKGTPAPLIPTLSDLLQDEALDPLGLQADTAETAAVSTTTPTDGSDIPEVQDLAGIAVGMGTLPSITTRTSVNLNEFKIALMQAATDAVADFHPDPTRYSFESFLGSVSLQAVMVSPMKYAVINNQRYSVGDHFVVNVPMAPTDVDLLGAMEKHMPPADAFPPEVMNQYRDAYDEVVQQLAAVRQNNPARFSKTITLPVTVLDIQPRKVIVNLQGQRHELSIRYAY